MVDSTGQETWVDIVPDGSDDPMLVGTIGANLFVSSFGGSGIYIVNETGAVINYVADTLDVYMRPIYHEWITVGDNLFFSAFDNNAGKDGLWMVNSAGKLTNIDVQAGAELVLGKMAGAGTNLFLVAQDSDGVFNLWMVDSAGNSSLILLGDSGVTPGRNVLQMVGAGSNLYILTGDVEYWSSTPTGDNLWKVDSYGELSHVNIAAAPNENYSSGITNLTVVGSSLFLSSDNELVMLDEYGVPININTATYWPDIPFRMAAIGDNLFLTSGDTVGQSVWIVDSITGGKDRIIWADAPAGGSDPYPLVYREDLGLVFLAYDGESFDLWSYGLAGAEKLFENPGWSGVSNYTQVGSTVFFVATDAAGSADLWMTDGESLVKIDTNEYGSDHPDPMVAVGDKLFAISSDNDGARALWKVETDGSNNIIDFNENGADFETSSMWQNLVALGDKVFVGAYDSGGANLDLWMVNTLGNTTLVNTNSAGSDDPDVMAAVGDKLFVGANDGLGNRDLWMVGDDGVAEPINIKENGSDLPDWTLISSAGDKLFVEAYDASGNLDLWMVDTLGAETHVDTNTEGADNPGFMVAVGDKMFVGAYGSDGNYDLWMVDTANGQETPINTNVNGNDLSEWGNNFISVDGKLFIDAYNDAGDLDLWMVDSNGDKMNLEHQSIWIGQSLLFPVYFQQGLRLRQ